MSCPVDQLNYQPVMTDLITRQEALAQGLRHYFTGKPCKRGHIAKREAKWKKCLDCDREKQVEKRRDQPEKVRSQARARYHANPGKTIAAVKRWCKENKEKRRVILSRYTRKRRREDPASCMVDRLRARVRRYLTRPTKAATTMELVGCTREQLVAHLEAQFLPSMTWENRSEWHIDHRLPCAAFDLLDPVHQRACFHYSNLQPLWRHDNLSKNDAHDSAEVAAWVERFR